MRYFLAIVCPPLAVLLCGKPVSALLNLFLCFLFIFPAWIHAFAVVKSHKDRQNMKRLENAILASARVAHQDAVNLSQQLKGE